MANLFFVYTPFQLFVAQQIIQQEDLKENVIIKGYVGNCRNFMDIYDVLIDKELWSAEYVVEDINCFMRVDCKKPFTSLIRMYVHKHIMNKIKKTHQIDSLYLGEINNPNYRITAIVYASYGIKISYYEEGSSHYCIKNISGSFYNKGVITWAVVTFFDIFAFLPLYGKCVGKYAFISPVKYKQLPITYRYNILDVHHESFDRILVCKHPLSNRTIEVIKTDSESILNHNTILFLEEPIYELLPNAFNAYFATIHAYFCSISKDTIVCIKYHPRETNFVRTKIEHLLSKIGLKHFVILKTINLPVEAFMSKYHFSSVVSFMASTSMYNGVLYSKTFFISLMNFFCNKYLDENPQYKEVLSNYMNNIKPVMDCFDESFN